MVPPVEVRGEGVERPLNEPSKDAEVVAPS